VIKELNDIISNLILVPI